VTEALVKSVRAAALCWCSDETVRDEARSLAVSYEVVIAQQIQHWPERLHDETIGVDPQSSVSRQQERPDEVGTLRRLERLGHGSGRAYALGIGSAAWLLAAGGGVG